MISTKKQLAWFIITSGISTVVGATVRTDPWIVVAYIVGIIVGVWGMAVNMRSR